MRETRLRLLVGFGFVTSISDEPIFFVPLLLFVVRKRAGSALRDAPLFFAESFPDFGFTEEVAQ